MNTVKETRLAQQRAYDAQQKEIAHILEFINKHDERPKIVAQKAELAMSLKQESEFAGGHASSSSSSSSFSSFFIMVEHLQSYIDFILLPLLRSME